MHKVVATVLFIGKFIGVIGRHIWLRLCTSLASFGHRLTYQSGPHPKTVVVVGASFAGYHTARCLANSLPSGWRVVVIEKNSHFQLTWVLPRFSVVEGHDHKAFIPYSPYVDGPEGSYEWIHDTVQSIIPRGQGQKGGRVDLASGNSIEYEYLVMATGSSGELPSRVGVESKKDGMNALREQRNRINTAHDIVVIGGGPAGVELAADAKSKHPQKNVTLIHSRKTLLHEGFGLKIHRTIMAEIEKLGVKVVLNEKPPIPKGVTSGEIPLKNGAVKFDCLVVCVGQKPNSSLLRFLSLSAFTQSGHIRAEPSLQVADSSYPHIYIAGDMVGQWVIKNARCAFEQAQVVAQNIVRAIQDRQPVEYRQQWWEGTTKITLGLGKSIIYTTDGEVEWVMMTRRQKPELDSRMVWKFLGATPYDDPTEDQESEEEAKLEDSQTA